jgi:hypothetical protein
MSRMLELVKQNAAEYGFTAHTWSVGREIRTCSKCGTREAYWDDVEYPINPCHTEGLT